MGPVGLGVDLEAVAVDLDFPLGLQGETEVVAVMVMQGVMLVLAQTGEQSESSLQTLIGLATGQPWRNFAAQQPCDLLRLCLHMSRQQ